MTKDYMQKYVSVNEFMEKGYLQEVNRQFFHPLGMALVAVIYDSDESKNCFLVCATGDPEGFCFDSIDIDKLQYVISQQNRAAKIRTKNLGFVIQEPAQK